MEAVAPSAPAQTGERRTRLATLAKSLCALAVLAALAAAGWGAIYSSLTTQAPPARVGETVEVPGGFLRVDSVSPERMASMQMGKFAQAGMAGMSSMGMDMAPEGQRRFVVDVTLAAERGDLSYSPEEFRISGKGIQESKPIRQQLDSGTLPAGSAISGALVFEAPEEAKELMLSFGDDGGQKVALDLKPATESDAHSHGAAVQSQADEDHSDGHHH